MSSLLRAIGRIPSGLFILTTRQNERHVAMLASWVQQAGFDPPSLVVALQCDRPIVNVIERTARFVVNQLADGQSRLMRHFAKPPADPARLFDDIATLDPATAHGGLVLAEALSYLDVEVVGKLDGGDHRLVLGRVIGGDVLRDDAQPLVHIRRNGAHY